MESPAIELIAPARVRRGRDSSLGDEVPESGLRKAQTTEACFHCGQPCLDTRVAVGAKVFCCGGCRFVHDLLAESGLGHFYDLNRHPGVRVDAGQPNLARWAYLDDLEVQQRLLDFADQNVSRVTFHVPAIHCVACVWLLENLFRLRPGVGRSRVNFPRREVSISFDSSRLRLSELAALLAAIGYEPRLTLGELDRSAPDTSDRKRWLQLGVAGFAFGNIMLFALPAYLGLDKFHGPFFHALFGYLSLGLALPVLVYSASDYWKSSWLSFKRKALTLDVPIALGMVALYVQSAWEILSRTGEGYLDSLAGLVFLLLCGRAFQHRTQERIAFDRDYRCFFPLSVTRRGEGGDEAVSISTLRVGDRLRLRNGELIPADSRLVSGEARIDYSFVTGEAEPVCKRAGDYLYAGGRQTGETIEVETVKPVSQSYLTSLWDNEAFCKDREDTLNSTTNWFGRRFTAVVIAVAALSAGYWIYSGDIPRGIKAFTSVLIVACPCALALSAPFTLGTAQRMLARGQVFLRNTLVLEKLARTTAIVFDKTGTLTGNQTSSADFQPAAAEGQRPLSAEEARRVFSLARHSMHPHSARIASTLGERSGALSTVGFVETPGCGIDGWVQGDRLQLGSARWLERSDVDVPPSDLPQGTHACLAINGKYRGTFLLSSAVRPQTAEILEWLAARYELALVSGDNDRDRKQYSSLFPPGATLRFSQSPADKLAFVRDLQQAGKRVMMVGDGLNDAGALRQSEVGVAVVEQVGAFSPASDVILPAARVRDLPGILRLARASGTIVRLCFGISAVYNLAGIGIAATGALSPLFSAVLMPLSSISVVAFACGATRGAAHKVGF